MKGGSVASNAVTKLVSEPAYNSLTKNFSHFTNSAKCGGKCAAKSCKPKPKSKPKSKKGGNPFSTVSNAVTKALSSTFGKNSSVSEGFNVFKSNAAPAGYEYANLRGNVKTNSNAKSGGNFQAKNMTEYMNSSNSYALKNRKGGSGGLDYSIITRNVSVSPANSRPTPNAVNRMLASNSVATSPSLIKSANYGSVKNSAHFFSYDGAPQMVKSVAGGKCKSKSKCKKST